MPIEPPVSAPPQPATNEGQTETPSTGQPKWVPTHGAVVTTDQAAGKWIFHGYKRDADKEGGFDTGTALLSADGKSIDRFFEVPATSLKAFVEPDISLRDEQVREDLARPVPGARPPARGVVSAIVALAMLPAMFFAGCSNLTPDEKAAFAATGSSVATAILNAGVKYGIANVASNLHGNPYADSAASALWSLSTQDIVTHDQVAATIAAFGDPNQKAKWSAFGNDVANTVIRYGASTATQAVVNSAAIAVSQLGHGTPPPPPVKS